MLLWTTFNPKLRIRVKAGGPSPRRSTRTFQPPSLRFPCLNDCAPGTGIPSRTNCSPSCEINLVVTKSSGNEPAVEPSDIVLSGNGFLHPLAAPILAAIVDADVWISRQPGVASLRGSGICALTKDKLSFRQRGFKDSRSLPEIQDTSCYISNRQFSEESYARYCTAHPDFHSRLAGFWSERCEDSPVGSDSRH